ncbi:unnamed protein product, partial [Amoebophrya sp. A25]
PPSEKAFWSSKTVTSVFERARGFVGRAKDLQNLTLQCEFAELFGARGHPNTFFAPDPEGKDVGRSLDHSTSKTQGRGQGQDQKTSSASAEAMQKLRGVRAYEPLVHWMAANP